MQQKEKEVSFCGPLVLAAVLFNAIVLKQALIVSQNWYGLLIVTIPLLIMSIVIFKRRHL